MTGVCVGCGARGLVERHHPTGRSIPGGAYHDAGLTVSLCKRCHDGEHVALRRLGLGWPGSDVVSYRLRRFGAFAVGLAIEGRGLVLDPASTTALGELVLAAADRETGA